VESSEAAEARLGEGARRVGWLSGCPIEPGNSGSPVLDAEGRLRALVHAGSHPVFGIGVTTALPSTELAAP
jgi:S1-C subfamily serine protease